MKNAMSDTEMLSGKGLRSNSISASQVNLVVHGASRMDKTHNYSSTAASAEHNLSRLM